jgi:hypothetical protein
VVGSLAEFGNDIATLAELQAQLALLDLKESTTRATVPLSLVAFGVAVILASLPVALLGVAHLVAAALAIKLGWALLLSAGGAVALGAGIATVAAAQLRRSFESFRRSRDEFSRNLAWIRTVLRYSGRAVPKRGA